MTVLISPGLAGTFAAAGTENNPIILWNNRASDGFWTTQTTGLEIADPNNMNTGTTFDRWVVERGASGNARAEVLLPAARTFNCICLAAHTISDGGGGNVAPQSSIDGGFSWQDTTAGEITPTDNQAICWLFDDAPTTDLWRIRVIDGVADEEVSIGVLFFGTFLQIPQRIYQGYTPPITPTRVDLQSNVSAGANLLEASIIREGSNMVANLTHLLPSFIRATGSSQWLAFQSNFNDGGAAFWMWRPTEFQDAFYGWRDGEPIIPTNSGPKSYMAASMGMRLFDEP